MAETYDEPLPGDGLVNLAFAGTGAVLATSVAAAAFPDSFARIHAVGSSLLFLIGTGALLWAYALGVSRSRAVVVTLGGLFFLAGGVAPATVRRRFRIALAVEVVAVVAAASIRPFTEVAFGILAPMFGLGLMSVWGGRYGVYDARPEAGPVARPDGDDP